MGYSTCWKCKTQFYMPEELEAAARASRGQIPVYCAYGHAGYFSKKSDDEIMIDRLKQQLAQKDDEIARGERRLENMGKAVDYQREQKEGAQRRLTATRGVVTRIKNRVGHGICPCCTRSFQNLAAHMKTQHADYAKSEENAQ